MKLRFSKMHGAGNDYIYVDTTHQTVADPSALSVSLSNRHTGIGSDGLVLIGLSPTPDADFTMRIFNADGSEAMMCGNASRCIGKYLYERRLTNLTTIRLKTLSGIKLLQLHVSDLDTVESVTVDMGEPVLENPKQFRTDIPAPLSSGRGAGGEAALFVSMGNPHYVIFTDDVQRVATEGPILETHPAFPERCNIEFAKPISQDTFRVRVWERGSGITMACGTGACATAVAAIHTGRSSRHVCIEMDGGTLHIFWNEADNHVYMTGPATFVFDGEIEL